MLNVNTPETRGVALALQSVTGATCAAEQERQLMLKASDICSVLCEAHNAADTCGCTPACLDARP